MMTKSEAVKVAVHHAVLNRSQMAVVTHADDPTDIGADHDALPLKLVKGNPKYIVRAIAWPDGGVDYQPRH